MRLDRPLVWGAIPASGVGKLLAEVMKTRTVHLLQVAGAPLTVTA